MPDYRHIYQTGAADYDLMVRREDYQGNTLKALNEIRPLGGCDVVEMGAGTGRVTRLVAPLVQSIAAFDSSAHMLAVAAQSLAAMEVDNWRLAVADNRHLPLSNGIADVSIAGWSFGHSIGWYPDSWQAEIGRAIDEMQRMLRPGGTAIILETMGTGSETPTPPTEGLAEYYGWLENSLGFRQMSIRTDYRFTSVAEAERLIRFFFGDDLATRVVRENLVVLPECTGLWWRSKP